MIHPDSPLAFEDRPVRRHTIQQILAALLCTVLLAVFIGYALIRASDEACLRAGHQAPVSWRCPNISTGTNR